MKNIAEILAGFSIEIPAEKKADFDKLFAENYKTIADYKKATTQRDEHKAARETAENTLKNFEGIDPEKIQQELKDWKLKAEQAEKDAQKRIDERDFRDALKTELDKLQFTSLAARKAVEDDIMTMELKHKDGKILGLADAIESIKAESADRFVDEKTQTLEQNKVRFTTTNPTSTSHQATMEDLGRMSMADYIRARRKE